MHKVYIKKNEKDEIIDIGSDVFIKDPENWIEIDEGDGDRYVHAQGNYLPEPLRDEDGNPNYVWTGGAIITKEYAKEFDEE